MKAPRDRIEKDPDRRVQEAIALVFRKFTEMQTVRQVHLWLRQERLSLPAVSHGPDGRRVEWKLPVYNTIHHMLTNPIYAGAYAFGRRITIEDGRKRIVRGFRKERGEWEALILDHHEGYISWAEFERNQRLITDNANGKNFMSRGSVRRGEALAARTAARPLPLPGWADQSWWRAVHLLRWHAGRPFCRRRGDRAHAAARCRGGSRRGGDAANRECREAAPS